MPRFLIYPRINSASSRFPASISTASPLETSKVESACPTSKKYAVSSSSEGSEEPLSSPSAEHPYRKVAVTSTATRVRIHCQCLLRPVCFLLLCVIVISYILIEIYVPSLSSICIISILRMVRSVPEHSLTRSVSIFLLQKALYGSGTCFCMLVKTDSGIFRITIPAAETGTGRERFRSFVLILIFMVPPISQLQIHARVCRPLFPPSQNLPPLPH